MKRHTSSSASTRTYKRPKYPHLQRRTQNTTPGSWTRIKGIPVYTTLYGTTLKGKEAYYTAKHEKQLRLSDKIRKAENGPLAQWNIPKSVQDVYMREGVKSLFQWQIECLNLARKEKRNLVYSAPTSGGKSLVAEILMIDRVVRMKQKAIIILPYVSLVIEKTKDLQKKMAVTGVCVKGLHSDAFCGLEDSVDIIVCTIEKANALCNTLILEGRFECIGCIVVDELHMIGDNNRGQVLESIITKLLMANGNHLIIGMSATLTSSDILAKWLDASLYITYYRPVSLKKHIVVGSNVYDYENNKRRCISNVKTEGEVVVALCKEAVNEGLSIIVFAPTRQWTVNCSRMLSQKLGSSISMKDVGLRVLQKLVNLSVPLCPILQGTLKNRIAFHHAGMTLEERKIIEDGFRTGYVQILVATSTVAVGVNLPAGRVIFRSPYIGKNFLDFTRYKQMSGRAGRTGQGNIGESYLICEKKDLNLFKNMLTQKNQPIMSQLDKKGMNRAILEAISCGLITCYEEITKFSKLTYLSKIVSEDELAALVCTAVGYLESHKLIEIKKDSIECLPLGSALSLSGIEIREGIQILKEFENSRKVSPVFYSLKAQWILLDEVKDKKTASLIGVKESFLLSARFHKPSVSNGDPNSEIIHRRFFYALILRDIVEEKGLARISDKYQIPSGTIQNLQSSASSIARMSSIMCRRLGWKSLSLILDHFANRICHGVQDELLPLMKIPEVTAIRARGLYDSGFQCIEDIASVSSVDIADALDTWIPFCRNKDIKNSEERKARSDQLYVAGLIANHARKLIDIDSTDIE